MERCRGSGGGGCISGVSGGGNREVKEDGIAREFGEISYVLITAHGELPCRKEHNIVSKPGDGNRALRQHLEVLSNITEGGHSIGEEDIRRKRRIDECLYGILTLTEVCQYRKDLDRLVKRKIEISNLNNLVA